MHCEIKHMAQKLPKSEIEHVELEDDHEYPSLFMDVSSTFGNSGNPVKSSQDLQLASLVPLADKEFLKTIQVEEIKRENAAQKDLFVTVSWYLKNNSSEAWPSDPDQVVLKCLSNDFLIKLKDLKITKDHMSLFPILPHKTSQLKVQFILP